MNRKIELSVGEWYHCFNRGVDKRKVFLSHHDYDRFLSLLYAANSTEPVRLDNFERNEQGGTLLIRVMQQERVDTLVDIGAYCLMPNHFHLLLHEKIENGITEFMRKVATGYTMYFNRKEDRTGALFGGTFKARHVNDDRYFKRIVNYIHANSAELIETNWKGGVVKNRRKAHDFLSSYRYSSMPEYTKNESFSDSTSILNRELIHEVYSTLPTVQDLFDDAIDFAKDAEIEK